MSTSLLHPPLPALQPQLRRIIEELKIVLPIERQLDHPLEKLITGTAAKFGGIVKLQKIPKVTLAFLEAVRRRPKKNHPESSKLDGTFSIEEDCSWLNHGGFAMEKAGGH